jgi:hypothetical protein
MALRLDGGFWGPSIRRSFIPEVQGLRDAVLNRILPALPDPEEGAEAYQEALWAEGMSRPSDGYDDSGMLAEQVQERGLERYQRLLGVRQAARNMACVMLWHLIEQQMLAFHMRQVLQEHEERDVRADANARGRLLRLEEFHRRLDDGGCSMKALPSWDKVDELHLVANAVKHGPGRSMDDLAQRRPSMFTLPDTPPDVPWSQPSPSWAEKPAAGKDLYVTEADLASYLDAAEGLWQEFSAAVEAHSAKP